MYININMIFHIGKPEYQVDFLSLCHHQFTSMLLIEISVTKTTNEHQIKINTTYFIDLPVPA